MATIDDSSVERKLQQLKDLYEKGLLKESSYEKMCEKILEEFSASELDTVTIIPEEEKGGKNLTIGDVVAQKYKILELLGRGGMGVVYKVEHLLLPDKRFFALKTLYPHYSEIPLFHARFSREVKIAMDLVNEHILTIRDFGEIPNGIKYYTMNFSSGITLAAMLKTERRISERRAFAIILQVLTALKIAHERNIIHRDLKPSNILVEKRSDQEHALVFDFGVGKYLISEGETQLTKDSIVGSVPYMSPEQASGRSLDSRTDLYSTGLILYEMLTEKLPFDGNTAIEILMARVFQEPVSPCQHNPNISPNTEAIIMKALAKDCENRFLSAGKFIQAIIENNPELSRRKR